MDEPAIQALGDSAIQLVWNAGAAHDALPEVHEVASQLRDQHLAGVVAVVTAFRSVAVHFDPLHFDPLSVDWAPLVSRVAGRVQVERKLQSESSRCFEIPVCYGAEFGPDLVDVASLHGLSAEEVIRRHSQVEYRVQMIGFTPGFPYLAGLPPELASPRKTTPRLVVPKGSVAIGGRLTGVYPLASPGGWNIIGRTPVELFCPDRHPPCLVLAGDRIRFVPIQPEDFVLRRSG
jgi:inhibitor of KinA